MILFSLLPLFFFPLFLSQHFNYQSLSPISTAIISVLSAHYRYHQYYHHNDYNIFLPSLSLHSLATAITRIILACYFFYYFILICKFTSWSDKASESSFPHLLLSSVLVSGFSSYISFNLWLFVFHYSKHLWFLSRAKHSF